MHTGTHLVGSTRSLLIAAFTTLLLSAPFFALAQTPDISYFGTALAWIDNLVFAMIPLLLALAVLLFIWGVIKYFIYGSDDESARATGRAYMLYALIGLVAIVAVWGLVNLLIQIIFGSGGANTASPAVPAGQYFPTIN